MIFKKIREWWNSKMLDRAVAKVGLKRCYSPFGMGYQPESDEQIDFPPKPPKGGTSQSRENEFIIEKSTWRNGALHCEGILKNPTDELKNLTGKKITFSYPRIDLEKKL